jgi:polyisoprenoid-binding protein YceI
MKRTMKTMKEMKMTARTIIAVATVAFFAATAAFAQPLAVRASGQKTITLNDKVGKNQFLWKSSAPGEEINGTAEGISGSFTFNPKQPAKLRGTLMATVATMASGNATRDEHIKSSTWLDAAKYPKISFVITSITNPVTVGSKLSGKAVGKFTMHGVTKQITVPFTLTYVDASEKTRARAAGDLVMFTAEFDVALADFKVVGREGLIGSKVGERIKIKANLFGTTL